MDAPLYPPLGILVRRPIPDGQKEVVATWSWRNELPSWTWPDATGEPLAVRLYSAGDSVELRLDGKSVGTKTATANDRMIAEFAVSYAPGTLEAVAYRGGREIGRKCPETVGAPPRLRLVPERAGGPADRLRYVGIEVVDTRGHIVPEAELNVALVVHGSAELIGFGSAFPCATGSFQSARTRTFRGRALAILGRTGGGGPVELERRSAELSGAAAAIRLRDRHDRQSDGRRGRVAS